MQSLLKYIDDEYGSVENYVESIGLSKSEVEAVRRNLQVPKE